MFLTSRKKEEKSHVACGRSLSHYQEHHFHFFLFSFQPLMKRFQVALQKHLEKQNEKVSLALKELVSVDVFPLSIINQRCRLCEIHEVDIADSALLQVLFVFLTGRSCE